MKIIFLFTIMLLIGMGGCQFAHADQKPDIGGKYEIKKNVYLMVVYKDPRNKKISKNTATGYLHSVEYAHKSDVAYQKMVPAGTVMVVLGTAPKVWRLPWLADRYFVRLNPDYSEDLDVILSLDRGMDGNLGGLNSDIFSRLE
ncbi:hypothetical protein [Thauera sp. Sel9]|uniref:hypothetical protein n=1 Tax=Thauera sp. Sel9 TaxID=2974299 RepID=UPI0021E19313|nr:hypothetical protein [Thauera sp. Sel9]MCV2218109.1 hypothetical protein [Thauera sp. Sel9]